MGDILRAPKKGMVSFMEPKEILEFIERLKDNQQIEQRIFAECMAATSATIEWLRLKLDMAIKRERAET